MAWLPTLAPTAPLSSRQPPPTAVAYETRVHDMEYREDRRRDNIRRAMAPIATGVRQGPVTAGSGEPVNLFGVEETPSRRMETATRMAGSGGERRRAQDGARAAVVEPARGVDVTGVYPSSDELDEDFDDFDEDQDMVPA
eukprot:CAMPEP_0198330578 /NCGR_PEP_ID=MMETSP1450-20131203/17007_1 /TAXON_ID=753684 ORGANISM="Madagascaria erythrocladiodes, Strain CCMP3234" /NCGR_SAMPLE_ID=MMETSP1450 /ASSEMBLY_ACC=CAM_ASM_001115 /LENGTH=139 /DNA_ID=CAMNT_0044034883 /DNA_START=55 /DNA_END=474 /DNA_ORIENTATION=+